MSRLLRGLMIGFIAIVAVILSALWMVLGTARGGQWLVEQATTVIPGALVVEQQQGSALSGFTARRIVYRDESLYVELRDVRIEIDLGALLRKRIDIERLTVAAMFIDELQLDDVNLVGTIELRDAFPLTANLSWTADDARVRGHGDFSGDLERLEFSHRFALPALVDVVGVVNAVLTTPFVDATASFREFPLMVGDDQIALRDGRIVVSGDSAALLIESSEATIFGGRVEATGSFDLQAGMTGTLSISGENFDPATLHPELDGRLGFSLHVNVRSADEFDVMLDDLSGEFLGKSVQGTGSARFKQSLVERVALVLKSGENQLELSGRMTPDFSGEWRLDVPELATLWPDAEGRLKGVGRVRGTREEPVALVRLEGDELRLGSLGLQRANINGRIDAAGELDWTAQIKNIRSGEQEIGDLELRLRGWLEDHRLTAHLTDGSVGLQLQTHGSWDGERWLETVDSAVIDSGAVGAWTLSEAVSMRVSDNEGSVDAHCWSNLPAKICVDEGRWHDGRWVGAATLRQFPLATFEPWMSEDLRISGLADADLTVDWDLEKNLDANLSWRQGETRLSVPVDDVAEQQEEIATTLHDVQLMLVANNEVATIEVHATGDYGLSLSASVVLDEGQLVGSVDARIPDLGELRPVLNQFVLTSRLGGSFTVSANISGTPSMPVAEGSAILQDGFAELVVNGIELREANLSITGHEGSALVVDGSVRSGDGFIDIDGQIDWSEERGVFSDLRLTGSDFEILRLVNQRATIAPTVDVSADSDQIVVAGRVLVPEAEFVVHELGQSAVMISDDVVVHEDEAPVRRHASGPRFVGSLDVQLGDRVSFSGFGIDTRLAGGLQLNQVADAPLSGEGSLRLVDGSYEMFGKVLTIEQGSLNFYGPLDDPVLDVRAARRVRYQAQNIRVGVIVTGRISRQLDFMLFSDPVYSEADILSYLLVDRPASTADGVDGSAISGAAVAMGLQSLTQGMGQGLSLDEVGLEGAGGDDTAVVAGKQLNEDFYVRYTYGLFSRVGTVLIRYDLGRGFSIEAGSGEQQTLDLLYSIDR